jgi:hypothetical protein
LRFTGGFTKTALGLKIFFEKFKRDLKEYRQKMEEVIF